MHRLFRVKSNDKVEDQANIGDEVIGVNDNKHGASDESNDQPYMSNNITYHLNIRPKH
jgi:hypothetical protein